MKDCAMAVKFIEDKCKWVLLFWVVVVEDDGEGEGEGG